MVKQLQFLGNSSLGLVVVKLIIDPLEMRLYIIY